MNKEKLLVYGVFLIAITVISAPIIYAIGQQMDTYGCFGPKLHYGYITEYGDNWVWLAPQTDHELLFGNFTLRDGLTIPEWVDAPFPASYVIYWGVIQSVNPY